MSDLEVSCDSFTNESGRNLLDRLAASVDCGSGSGCGLNVQEKPTNCGTRAADVLAYF